MVCPDPPDLEPLRQTLIHSAVAGAILLGLQFTFPRTAERVSAFCGRLLQIVARRRVLAAVLLFLAVIVTRVALLPRFPVPVPGIHDEFSYLLMADTFAHGRLSNPPHAMWMSLETFHVNFFPRYASMYPPAQGVALAFGQVLGAPWIGVLVSCALMVAAIYWMLLAWVPRRWAALGGVAVWLKFCVTSYWVNSYWGGAVSAIGGALVLGALARLRRAPRPRYAVVLAVGLAILANSRPYEGFLFGFPAGVYLLYWIFRSGSQRFTFPARVRQVLLPIILPIVAVLAVTAVAMGFYSHNLTGNALVLPESLNVRTHHTAPMFLFQASKAPLEYHNQQFEDFYNDWEREEYDHTWGSIGCLTWLKSVRLFSAFSWWGMLLALPGIYFLMRNRRLRLPWLMLGLVLIGAFVIVWSNAHYVGPATCVVVLLYLCALRYTARLKSGGSIRWGAALARTSVLLLVVDTGAALAHKQCDTFYWTCQGDVSRLVMQHKLEAQPGKHLVIVRYSEDHNIHDEWVYNAADIDGSKVVWAREIDPEQDAALFDYFRDRRVWLVTPDSDNTYLAPYTAPGSRSTADSDR